MPEQVQLEGQLSVLPVPGDRLVMSIDTGAGRIYTIPLDREAAEGLSKALAAPSVALPGNGQVR